VAGLAAHRRHGAMGYHSPVECSYNRLAALHNTEGAVTHSMVLAARRGAIPALAMALWSRGAAAQPLPEGDGGIAAQYPGDEGIGGDPEVLLHEDFESVTGGSLTSENSAFDSVYGDNSITTVAADVHGGAQAVQRTHTSPTSFGAVKHLGEGFDTLHIRYYLKYHELFPGCHHTGGGIYAAAGSGYTEIGDITAVRPNGSNHFQAWLDDMAPFFDWNPPGNDEPPGWLNFYCYHMDQDSEYGDVFFPDGTVLPGSSGADFGPEFVPRANDNPPRGQWASYEVMLQANAPGSSDGRIAFWVDGELVGDFPNLRLRSTADLALNHVALSTYSSEYLENQTIWYDDVVVATSYIGPMFADAGTGSDPGANQHDSGAGRADDSTEAGCGCRLTPHTPPASTLLFGIFALAALAHRRHARS
jgi:MYXO-CTERM domain-containing protein